VGIAADLFLLTTLLLLKTYLTKVGVWHYVRTKSSIYKTPSFKQDEGDMGEEERRTIEEKR
jgi:hypothetical protein